MSDYFSGSLHLNHINIIQYNNRPWKDTDEMNQALLDNINKTVQHNDRLYIVGNYLFGPLDESKYIKTARYFRNKINCRNVFLIMGNHDRRGKRLEEFTRLFVKTTDYMEITCGEAQNQRTLILFAYPIVELSWNRCNKGAYHLFSSTKLHKNLTACRRLNVGVDFAPQNLLKIAGRSPADCDVEEWKTLYRPYSFEEVKYILDPAPMLRVEESAETI